MMYKRQESHTNSELNHLAVGLCLGILLGVLLNSLALGILLGIAAGGMLDTWETQRGP